MAWSATNSRSASRRLDRSDAAGRVCVPCLFKKSQAGERVAKHAAAFGIPLRAAGPVRRPLRQIKGMTPIERIAKLGLCCTSGEMKSRIQLCIDGDDRRAYGAQMGRQSAAAPDVIIGRGDEGDCDVLPEVRGSLCIRNSGSFRVRNDTGAVSLVF
jgi:hypothetical protein